MRHTIWILFHRMLWYNRWHIVFITSLICVSSAEAKPLVFTLSDEEREQWKYQKIEEIQAMQVMPLADISTDDYLTETTYKNYQNYWMDIWYDTYFTGEDSYQYWIADAIWNLSGEENEIQTMRSRLDHITLTLLPLLYHTNTAFKAKTEEQLDDVIAKLDKLAGDDGSGNANINVNFQPLQQVLTDIKDLSDIQRQRLSEIEMETYAIAEDTKMIEMFSQDTVLELIDANKNLQEGFEINNRNLQTANNTLAHIDEDLHQIKDEGLKIDWEAGGGTNYLDQVIGKHFDKLTDDIENIVDETTKPEKLEGEYLDETFNQEQQGQYLINTIVGAKDQLQSELNQIQYTNINAKVYDYDDYNNYYTLDAAATDPTSNDQFIREKVQEYIDQVTYTTETIKGQVTTRLDELKQSTLLTTDYDPEWLVVKQGALSEKYSFPKSDWKVDFSKIKLESNIAKTIYDWIYYLLAVLIIYKQFSKVV